MLLVPGSDHTTVSLHRTLQTQPGGLVASTVNSVTSGADHKELVAESSVNYDVDKVVFRLHCRSTL